MSGNAHRQPKLADELRFDRDQLAAVRRLVSRWADAVGLNARRRADLVVAVNELATNSIRHAGGSGMLGIWREGDSLVCEVRDRGRFDGPRFGRKRPPPDQISGRGLWIVNQLCDLVQFRSVPGGTAVRIGMRLG